METWDKLDDISIFTQTKNILDADIYFMQHHDKTHSQPPHNKRVRITLRSPNDGKQFLMERILRRQIEENEKINRDASLRRNKKIKRKSHEKRSKRGFKAKRSKSPRRKSQRSPVRKVAVEECDVRSSLESQQSSKTKRGVLPNTVVHHIKDVDSVRNSIYNVKTSSEEDKWHPQNIQPIPLYRNFTAEEKQLTKEVKYVRISALSPRCFARQNLSNTHGMYEADGYFSEEFNTSKLPSLYGSENEHISTKEDNLLSPKPEVVHYTDGYSVGSIEVFEPIYILNSLCKNSRQPGGMTPRSEVSSLHHQRRIHSSKRRESLTSNASQRRRESLTSNTSRQRRESSASCSSSQKN